MKVVIFAGGHGSRLSEETTEKPKPMVEIGGKPILWHVMKIYSHYGFNDFVICLGYKGFMIKEWVRNLSLHCSDVTVDLSDNSIITHANSAKNWKVTLIDTGVESNTATRLKLVRKYLDEEDFMLTYGDGVSDININKLLDFHKSHNKIATVTSVRPVGRFGILNIDPISKVVNSFVEKNESKMDWINGGFFVLRPQVFDYIPEFDTMWEKEPMEKLASDNELMAYMHEGFWKPMDTLRDKKQLEELWVNGNAPWKV